MPTEQIRKWLKERHRRRNARDRESGRRSVATPTRRPLTRWLVALGAIAVIWFVCAINVSYRYQAGRSDDLVAMQRVAYNLIAQTRFEYVDEEETDRLRDRAAERVLDTYTISQTGMDTSLSQFDQLFQALDTARPGESPHEFVSSLDEQDFARLLPLFDIEDKRKFVLTDLKDQLTIGVVDGEHARDGDRQIMVVRDFGREQSRLAGFLTPKQVAERITTRLSSTFHLTETTTERETTVFILSRLIAPTLRYDGTITQSERTAARMAVVPVRRTVPDGATLVRAGEQILPIDLKLIKAHDEALLANQDSYAHALSLISTLLLAFVVISLGALYLQQMGTTVFTNRSIMATAVIVTLNIGLNRFVQEGLSHWVALPQAYIPIAIPCTFTAVLLALLYGFRLAMASAVFFSVLWAVMSADPMKAFLLGLTASAAAAWALRKVRTRKQTFRAPLLIALALLVVEGIHLFVRSTPPDVYMTMAAVALISAFCVIMLANLLLPAAEWLTGVTTDISLLELSDLNHRLLKRLQLEAPGTYHHTQMVATLAEHAAEAIDANPLLARVAAYFHDIGKLYNPSYFTENSTEQNRHTHLRPRMSALVIINHVKEGLALANRYKLRKPLREAIATHHGTSLVACFYHQACQEATESGAKVTEEDFRYPGPLPRGKEVSIISLVDACEAASRSLEKPTPQKIDNMVAEIFRSRINDGQLDDSELTLQEIRTIEATTRKTLCTMLHGRIAYPKNSEHGSILLEPSNADPEESAAAGESPQKDHRQAESGARLVS